MIPFPQTRPSSFRVPIGVPSESKVNAIAAYKRKRMQEINSPRIVEETKYAPISEFDLREKLKLLEQLYGKGQELHHEFESLNNVKYSLLWLLQKVSLVETDRNHSDT